MKKVKINKFDLVVALYIFGTITVNLMGAKVMPLGSAFGLTFNISVAIFLMPLLYTIIDVVSEIYGRERARSLVSSGLVTIVLLVLFMMLATNLPAAARFTAEPAYQEIFGISIRFGIASVIAFACGEILDVMVYSKIKKITHGKAIWLRNNISNCLGELVDSVIFIVIAFYSFGQSFGENALWLIGLVLPYWIAKCVMSFACTPLVYGGIAYMRKRNKVNTVDA